MKTLKFTIFILALYTFAVYPCFAQKKLDNKNESVQLLKTLVNEGDIARQYDKPIEKADISEDTVLVRELKQEYYEKNQRMLDVGKKKNNKKVKSKK